MNSESRFLAESSSILSKLPEHYCSPDFQNCHIIDQLKNLLEPPVSRKTTESSLSESNPFANESSEENNNPFNEEEPTLDDQTTLKRLKSHEIELTLSAKKVSNQVQQEVQTRHAEFLKELTNITNLKSQIKDAYDNCQRSRCNIQYSADVIAHPLFDIKEKNDSRESLKLVLQNLKLIQSIKCQLDYLDANIQTRNLLKATKTYDSLNSKSYQPVYNRFRGVELLVQNRLEVSRSMIETQLGEVLDKIAKLEFNKSDYNETIECYHLLGQSQSVPETLVSKFLQSVNHAALSMAFQYTRVDKFVDEGFVSCLDIPLEKLCQHVPDESYLDCLLGLCTVMWKVMVNYRSLDFKFKLVFFSSKKLI